MSHSSNHSFMSPTQRRACLVVALCAVAIGACFLLSWVILPNLLAAQPDDYDPTLYPLDTTLTAILPQGTESADYMAGTVFAGDAYPASLQSQNLITLDQFAGAQGMSLSTFTRDACVYFADDPSAYTVPQAVSKMKPRRVVLCLGSQDVGAYNGAEAFILAYRQAVSAIQQAYPYCDVIVSAIPPVRRNTDAAAARQTAIDQYNQALALMCQADNLPFLNTTDTLKAANGYAQDSYFDNASGTYTASGGNALLMYFRQHPYNSADRRPAGDAESAPRRAAQPAAGGNAAAGPSPTPQGITAAYIVEDATRGTLTTPTTEGLAPGTATTGAERLEFGVAERTTITVTAVPKPGWAFVRWSDGQTNATRTDVVLDDISVVAVFGQLSIEMRWNDSPCENGQVLDFIKVGETHNFTVRVVADGVEDKTKSAQAEWVVNEQTVARGSSYSFTPTEGGNYDIIVGYEPDPNDPTTAVSTYITVEVPAPPTTVAINEYSANTVTAGQSVTLKATVQNGSGQTTWSCDGLSWSAQGDSATFTAPGVAETTQYTVRARNNGAEATIVITVNPVQQPSAPTPAPTPEPTPAPPAEAGDQPPATP